MCLLSGHVITRHLTLYPYLLQETKSRRNQGLSMKKSSIVEIEIDSLIPSKIPGNALWNKFQFVSVLREF